jgi:hypothetical protein
MAATEHLNIPTYEQFAQLLTHIGVIAESMDIVEYEKEMSYTAEAWAVGTKNGIDVGSSDPQYHNNSKYYLEQAEAVAESIPEDYSELSDDVDQLKNALMLQEETIPDTVQTITFDSAGNVSAITHTANNVAVRTDAFTFGTDTITEVRTLSTGESLPANPSIGRSSPELNAMSQRSALRSSIVSPPRQSVPAMAPAYAFFAFLAFMALFPAIVIMPPVLYAMKTRAETGQFGVMRPGMNSAEPLCVKPALIVRIMVKTPIMKSTGTINLNNFETPSKSPRTVIMQRIAMISPPAALLMPNCCFKSDPPAAVIAMIME